MQFKWISFFEYHNENCIFRCFVYIYSYNLYLKRKICWNNKFKK